jgi:SAM-dependent methyltransferase
MSVHSGNRLLGWWACGEHEVVLPEVREYYRRLGETTRLSAGAGRLEFLRTRDILSRVLPPAPARVLDVGGATGVYAGPLAADGYAVHVVDMVAEQVALAAELPGVTASVGDARALAEPDASVDAVLLFGPLYHLVDRDERIVAWREAARVVRPGGVIAAALINRYASLHDGLARALRTEPAFAGLVVDALETGVHRPDRADGRWFTTAYLHHPGEVAAEVADAGLRLERLVSVEGPVWSVWELDAWLAEPASTERLLGWLRRIEADRALLGASSHLMAVVRSAG